MSHTKTAPAPGRAGTPAGGVRCASAAGSEEPEIATDVDRRRDPPRQVLRAADSEGRRWRGLGAVDRDTLPDRVRIADAPLGES